MSKATKQQTGRRSRRPSLAPGSAYWPLFKHMSQEHGLTLLDSEMEDICQVVLNMRPGMDLKGFTAKQWAEIRKSYRNTPNGELRRGAKD